MIQMIAMCTAQATLQRKSIQFCVISTFGNLNWPQKAQVKAKVCKEKEKLNKCILSKISKKERKDIQMAYKAKKGQSGTKPGRHIYVEDEQAWIHSVKDLISKKNTAVINCINAYHCSSYFR